MTLRLGTLLLLPGLLATLFLPPARTAPPDRRIAGFRLQDPRDRRIVALGDLADRKALVVIFLGTECPVSNAFLPVLAALHKEYAPRGVQFLGINANRQDTPERVGNHARKAEVPFPVLKDPGNKVADGFGARRTPEAYILDPAGKVLYQGRIDDQFGVGYQRAGKPTRRDLVLALDEILAGKPVTVARTKAAGCLIARAVKPKEGGAVTFARDVSRILQRRCQECHRPGQVGPMSLLTHDDAVSWAETIREVVTDGRMPPWHADARYGTWTNDRRLAAEERKTLLAWLDGGMARGDDRDLPPARKYPEGWVIGKPDLVLKMPEPFAVPAVAPRGGIPYQHFWVKPGFKEDRWVVAAEAKPDQTAVVHHIVMFIVKRGEIFFPDRPGSVLCGTAPGDMPLLLRPGQAKRIPAGARLVFQMHYTPNGKACTDQSSVGIIFAKKPPKHHVLTYPIHNVAFAVGRDRIPAGADNYKIEANFRFKRDAHLINFMPHMHLRGKDFLYEAIYPDGRREVLLKVPRYDFNWQSIYRCARPLPMPKGTRLHCVAHFDNSAKNPNNPDPKRNVFWGDQTWEEMMIGWIDYYFDDDKP